jgi:hypothetical protein
VPLHATSAAAPRGPGLAAGENRSVCMYVCIDVFMYACNMFECMLVHPHCHPGVRRAVRQSKRELPKNSKHQTEK